MRRRTRLYEEGVVSVALAAEERAEKGGEKEVDGRSYRENSRLCGEKCVACAVECRVGVLASCELCISEWDTVAVAVRAGEKGSMYGDCACMMAATTTTTTSTTASSSQLPTTTPPTTTTTTHQHQ